MYEYYYTNGENGELLTTGFSSEVLEEGPSISGWYLRNGKPAENYILKSSDFDIWDSETLSWKTNPNEAALIAEQNTFEFEKLKTEKWNKVKSQRDAFEFGGFTWDGSKFDSDSLSQNRIQLAAQLAQTNPNLVVDWTLADNTVRPLTAVDVSNVTAALGTHINTAHSTARLLRTEIEEAVNLTELSNIPDWL